MSLSKSESKPYTVSIWLGTEEGELPSDEIVEGLIADQMEGVLNDDTGLSSLAVHLVRVPLEEILMLIHGVNDLLHPDATFFKIDDEDYERAIATLTTFLSETGLE